MCLEWSPACASATEATRRAPTHTLKLLSFRSKTTASVSAFNSSLPKACVSTWLCIMSMAESLCLVSPSRSSMAWYRLRFGSLSLPDIAALSAHSGPSTPHAQGPPSGARTGALHTAIGGVCRRSFGAMHLPAKKKQKREPRLKSRNAKLTPMGFQKRTKNENPRFAARETSTRARQSSRGNLSSSEE